MSSTVIDTNPTTEREEEKRPDWANATPIDRPRKVRRMSLRLLREGLGLTQTEVAAKADMGQGDLSKLENREDLKLSTLVRYLDALGAKVEITAVLEDRRVVLDLGQPK